MKKNYSRLIHNRIKIAYDIKNDTLLSEFLGISQSTTSTSISRGTVNWDLIFEKCDNLSIDWLLTGYGEMFRNLNQRSQKEDPVTIESLNFLIKMLRKENETLRNEVEELKNAALVSSNVNVAEHGQSSLVG